MEELNQQLRHAKIMGWVLVDNSHILKRNNPITLRKGNTYIWMCRDYWQVADLLSGGGEEVSRYANHRPEKTLVAAIDNNS